MSKELTAILRAYDALDHSKQRCALATVVHVEGSSYRRPGARMLVTDDGAMTGAISGGCLEGDALRKARLVMHQGEATVVTYDTMDDDDSKLGIGLGCNGIVHVLLEPVNTDDPVNPIHLIRKTRLVRQTGIVVTIFSRERIFQPGTCAVFPECGDPFFRTGSTELQSLVETELAQIHRESGSRFVPRLGNSAYSAFIERLDPPVSLVIVGAGNDVLPLADLAAILGWELTVVDGRASHAKSERFPGALRVVVARAGELASLLSVDNRTCFVLMTHNYAYDIAALGELLDLKPIYIGVLGPKKKMQRMCDDLGIDTRPQNVYGPVGLDIGAETPEEIALSIVAEIQAVLAGKDIASLRDLQETIHPRSFSMLAR